MPSDSEGTFLDVLHHRVAELLVEGDCARVLDDHLEPDPLDAAQPRLLVDGAHECLGYTGPPSRRDHADAADPCVPVADAEVREPDQLAVPIRDPRRINVEVELVLHPLERGLVDVHGHEVALVCRGEELRALGRREHPRGAKFEAHRGGRRCRRM